MGIDRMLRLTHCIRSASATQRFAFGTRLALSAKNVQRADMPLRNIVALLAWCASHCSLFLHLSAVPASATGSGAALRPSWVRFPPKGLKTYRPQKRSAYFWWRQRGSNPRPHGCEPCALTS